ncbi:MAG: prepilin-type N-terminal cleavage/methylation domain-containing protein [bacterium]|nr:prepilin-type N-terminal cleavage/methylation domain-containing protein [bacterium]
MLKTKQTLKQGFTIIELLIVIAIIAILALLVLNNFQGAQAKARDTQRRTDLNNVHGKLEEFYNEKGGYPNETLTVALFPGMDEGSVKDADNVDMRMNFSTGAVATNNTDNSNGGEYQYAAYNCDNAASTVGAFCDKYELRAFIEKPAQTTDNPFVKKSLN